MNDTERDAGTGHGVFERLAPPPRQILIRERGQVRYVSLSPQRQLIAVAAGFLALAAVLAAGTGLLIYDQKLTDTRAALREAKESNTLLLSSMTPDGDTVFPINRAEADDATQLTTLIDQARLLDEEMERAKRRLGDEILGARASAIQESLSVDLQAMEGALRAIEGRGGRMKTGDVALSEKSPSLPSELPLDDSERSRLIARLQGLETRIASLQERQRTVMGRLSESTVVRMEKAERTIRLAGLDVDKLIAEISGEGGVGGPFVALRPDVKRAEADSKRSLDKQIKRWESIQSAIRFLPLNAPMRNYEVMSGFGPRRDPFNGQPAMHSGLDMVGALGSPVAAAADGHVAYVGWKDRYGKMVEIDHGIGVRTRYGHLRKMTVRAGDTVKAGDVIGEMGNSGRSTGPHLHYEVLVKGQARDPMRFIKAGANVRKD